jgi:ubiquinone/menaquinone biosynthesis C-methylase UbiE
MQFPTEATDLAASDLTAPVTESVDLLPGLAAGSHLGAVQPAPGGVEVYGGAAAWAYAAIAPFDYDGPGVIVARATGLKGRMSVGILSAARDDVWMEQELTGAADQEVRLSMVDLSKAGGVVLRTFQDGTVAPTALVSSLALEPLPEDAPERLAFSLLQGKDVGAVTDQQSSSYWTRHNVTFHKSFASAQESLDYFEWRNEQYFNYIELMPVAGYDGKVVLDYGCGPGHDLVGFGHFSKPARLVGADVSPSSLEESRRRMTLHGFPCDLVLLDLAAMRLPFDDATFDHIHSSGVLHHTPDPAFLLKELRRVLKPGGTMNVMIYNYDSISMHFFVAYQKQLVERMYADLTMRQAFTYTTDGPECPISMCYTPEEWIAICNDAGFDAVFTGVGVGLGECEMAARRFEACKHPDLPKESRAFLRALTFDERGLPMYRGHYAGVDACFALTPR